MHWYFCTECLFRVVEPDGSVHKIDISTARNDKRPQSFRRSLFWSHIIADDPQSRVTIPNWSRTIAFGLVNQNSGRLQIWNLGKSLGFFGLKWLFVEWVSWPDPFGSDHYHSYRTNFWPEHKHLLCGNRMYHPGLCEKSKYIVKIIQGYLQSRVTAPSSNCVYARVTH